MTRYAKLTEDESAIDSITYYPDLDEEGLPTNGWFAVADNVYSGFVSNGSGGWVKPEDTEEPIAVEQLLSLYGAAQLALVNGEVSGLPLVSRFSAAFQMGVGETWVFFSETQPSTDYMVLVYPIPGAVGYVQQINKFQDFFIITVTDYAGNPTDAEFMSLEVKKVG